MRESLAVQRKRGEPDAFLVPREERLVRGDPQHVPAISGGNSDLGVGKLVVGRVDLPVTRGQPRELVDVARDDGLARGNLRLERTQRAIGTALRGVLGHAGIARIERAPLQRLFGRPDIWKKPRASTVGTPVARGRKRATALRTGVGWHAHQEGSSEVSCN